MGTGLLQEEVADGACMDGPRQPASRPPDTATRAPNALPLPPPPPRATPLIGATDRHDTDAATAEASKVKTLRDYRRARGLCFKCGERCEHDHTYPTFVQLHVIEELLELFGINTPEDQGASLEEEPPQGVVMTISLSTLTGSVSPLALQVRSWIQGCEVLMLVDSGNTTSFINERFATNTTGVRPLPRE